MSTMTIAPEFAGPEFARTPFAGLSGFQPDAVRTPARARRPRVVRGEVIAGGLGRPAPQAVRLTERGQMLVAVLVMCLAGLGLLGLSGGAMSWFGGGATPVRIVHVGQGDTLYGIAGRIAQPGHVQQMVAQIEELNSLPDGGLQPGQDLAVPAAR